ncbi:hypothetical protein ZIOFF_064614 [Zingiber officinale]|uniref:RNA ligase/cyclic nucleotide phosphodiesterase family protein n=1 Tax=Zingiber officinale TaxID=94328 RepID=A0A8J5K8E1_ZINOF|nr:hypothetical protein ZIOFF_064614 [Zingiber officinale]
MCTWAWTCVLLGPFRGPNIHCDLARIHSQPPASRLHLAFPPPPHRQLPPLFPLLPVGTLMAEDPTKAAKEVYSVWALPPDDVRDRIKRIMAALRSEFGGPAFEPHITVVGAISLAPDDALCRFRSACAALSRYPARVSAAARGTFFYQCVFLLVDPTPEARPYYPNPSFSPLQIPPQNLNWISSFIVGLLIALRIAAYMPHLSLLYADLPDEVKEKARLRVEELDKEITGINFEVAALALYRTDTEDKSLESWEPVEVYQLPPNPK